MLIVWIGLSSFFFLYERVGDLFTAVHRRDDDEEGATRDDQAELAVPYVAFVVYHRIRLGLGADLLEHTCHGLLHLIQHQVHQLVVALQRSNDCTVVSLVVQSLHATAVCASLHLALHSNWAHLHVHR